MLLDSPFFYGLDLSDILTPTPMRSRMGELFHQSAFPGLFTAGSARRENCGRRRVSPSQLEERNRREAIASAKPIPYRITKGDEQYTIELSVPSVRSSDLLVEVTDGGQVLHVHGLGVSQKHRSTRIEYYQRFQLDRRLLDVEGMKGRLSNGVLMITIPKKAVVRESAEQDISIEHSSSKEEIDAESGPKGPSKVKEDSVDVETSDIGEEGRCPVYENCSPIAEASSKKPGDIWDDEGIIITEDEE